MNIPTFQKPDGRLYRIAARWGYEWEYGYAEPAQVCDNVLQVRRFGFWWQTVETERVPTWAWINQACLGFSDWESELIKRHRPQ